MTQAVGAKFRIHTDTEVSGTIMPYDGLTLNTLGERFTNESGFYERIFSDLSHSTPGVYKSFMIFDSSNLRENTKQHHTPDGSLRTRCV